MKGVTANDALGASTITVRQAKRLCAPVNKNNEDPTAPSHPGHQTFYTIKQTGPKFDRVKDLTVTDQFGTIEVDLVRPERLLVPTSKSLSAPPPPALGVPLDHYKCYRVRGARVRVPNVSVQTQFNPAGPVNVAIKRPRDLCFPVDKNGEGINDPTRGLMCYQVRTLPQQPPHVWTTDQFGSADYDLFGIRDLCVPLLAGPGRCGDGFLNSPGEQCEVDNDGNCPGRCDTETCTCTEPEPCGNGTLDPGEQCEQDSDCLTQCRGPAPCSIFVPLPQCTDCQCVVPPYCGDGVVNGTEECDDGLVANADNRDCTVTCEANVCGDGKQNTIGPNGIEACDDGNLDDGDGCDSNCTPTECGNGVQTTDEACDDGNLTDGDGCDSNCTATGCGNGITTAPEECDDGNTTGGDGCEADCTLPPVCAAVGEACSDSPPGPQCCPGAVCCVTRAVVTDGVCCIP